MAKHPSIPKCASLEEIKKQFAPPSLTEKEKYQYQKTGCLPVDFITKGRGLPLGKFIQFYSESKMGKSTTVLASISSSIQKYGCKWMYLDVEGTSQELIESMGVPQDPDHFCYLQPSFYDDLFQVTLTFLSSEYQFLVVDSLSAVCASPKNVIEEGIEKATVGLEARIYTAYLKLVHNLIKTTDKSIIFISQTRSKIGGTGWAKTEDDKVKVQGGKAVEFFMDLVIRFRGNKTLSADDMHKNKSKAILGKAGYMIAEKNKFTDGFSRIPFTVLFGRGVSNIEFLREFLEWKGDLKSAGPYKKLIMPNGEVETIQGVGNLSNAIRDHSKEFADMAYEAAEDYFEYLRSGLRPADLTDTEDEE